MERGVLEREIERIVDDFLKAEEDEKAMELLKASVIVLTAEKMIADAGAGERSEIARKIAEMVGSYTLPLTLTKIRFNVGEN